MKQIILLVALALSPIVHADPVPAAAAKAAEEQAALLKLAKEVQAQQATMAANQVKIEERLTAVAEAIRVARIYSSRSGN